MQIIMKRGGFFMDEKNKKNKWKSKKILGCILTVIIMVAAAAGIYFYTPRYVLPSLRERSHPASEAGV